MNYWLDDWNGEPYKIGPDKVKAAGLAERYDKRLLCEHGGKLVPPESIKQPTPAPVHVDESKGERAIPAEPAPIEYLDPQEALMQAMAGREARQAKQNAKPLLWVRDRNGTLSPTSQDPAAARAAVATLNHGGRPGRDAALFVRLPDGTLVPYDEAEREMFRQQEQAARERAANMAWTHMKGNAGPKQARSGIEFMDGLAQGLGLSSQTGD